MQPKRCEDDIGRSAPIGAASSRRTSVGSAVVEAIAQGNDSGDYGADAGSEREPA